MRPTGEEKHRSLIAEWPEDRLHDEEVTCVEIATRPLLRGRITERRAVVAALARANAGEGIRRHDIAKESTRVVGNERPPRHDRLPGDAAKVRYDADHAPEAAVGARRSRRERARCADDARLRNKNRAALVAQRKARLPKKVVVDRARLIPVE